MTTPLDYRLSQTDAHIRDASVSIAGLPQSAINLAHDLCQHFDLQLGTLIRRANAIALADGGNAAELCERLREAAQHLDLRTGD